jgi:5-bromo-4-chloroindolyl phosphate hydrolysis protein
VLYFLSSFSPSFCSCYAEVRLTDKEAELILTELTESRKELESVRAELEDVKKDCKEQRISYEKQLEEAEHKSRNLEKAVVATSSCSVLLLVLLLL